MGRPAITVKYPFAPLAALMGMSEAKAMRVLGVAGRTARQYREQGMSELVADRMAVKAGLVPWECWPEMLDKAMVDTEEARKARKRKAQAKWRRTRNGRAYTRFDNARYKSENADYLRWQKARYVEANREAINARRRAKYARERKAA